MVPIQSFEYKGEKIHYRGDSNAYMYLQRGTVGEAKRNVHLDILWG